MTPDLPTIVAELRALFIVALMNGGATREDAERKATPDIYYNATMDAWLTAFGAYKEFGHHARAIASDFYEALWCGLSVEDHYVARSQSTVSVCDGVRDWNDGDKLSAILKAMRALYAEGQP